MGLVVEPSLGKSLQDFDEERLLSLPALREKVTVVHGPEYISPAGATGSLEANSSWGKAPNPVQIAAVGGAFPLLSGSADSAILTMLNPGSYTAKVTSNGTVLVEVYEVP